MLSRLFSCMVVCVAIAGCATPVSRIPEKLAAPDGWVFPGGSTGLASLSADTWWHELADAQLNELVDVALNSSPDVEIAAARVRQARALIREASANRMPQMDAGTGVGRQRLPESLWRDDQGKRLTIPPYQQSGFSARVDARLEVDVWGRLAMGERMASAEFEASREDLRAVRQWLATEVVLAYADLRLADDRAHAARQARRVLEELVHAERVRLSAGLIPSARVREVERLVAAQVDAGAVFDQARHAALNRLANLLGKWTSQLQVQHQEGYFLSLNLSGSMTPDLPARVLENRADVAASWQRARVADVHAERIRLERYPALNLTGSAGFISPVLRSWLSTDAVAWAAQSLIQTRVFDGGRLEARGEQARAMADASFAQYRKTVLAALAEVETALSLTQTARERVLLAQEEFARRKTDTQHLADRNAVGLVDRPALLERKIEQLAAGETLSLRRYELLMAWSHAHASLGR